MRHWVGVLPEEQFANERLYARESIVLAGDSPAEPGPEAGDAVALVAGRPAVLIGHGSVAGREAAGIRVSYSARLFDDPPPLPADVLPSPSMPGVFPLPAAQFTRLAALVNASADAGAGRAVWFVSLALPIEAGSPAEAVREFWSYVDKLGPRELPAYVWPLGDELAMQAFVLGAVTNLDPEEDGD